MKVWIYKGEVLDTTLRAAAPEPEKRERRERRDRRQGDRRQGGERRQGDRPYNRREGGNR